MVSADCLLLLSNVEGLYEKDPSEGESELIKLVENIDNKITLMAGEAGKLGRGGMVTKIEAAKIATKKWLPNDYFFRKDRKSYLIITK